MIKQGVCHPAQGSKKTERSLDFQGFSDFCHYIGLVAVCSDLVNSGTNPPKNGLFDSQVFYLSAQGLTGYIQLGRSFCYVSSAALKSFRDDLPFKLLYEVCI